MRCDRFVIPKMLRGDAGNVGNSALDKNERIAMCPSVYVGCYFRAWMPKEKISAGVGTCSMCKKRITSPFCPQCGESIVLNEVELFPSFYDFSEAVFGDGDRFYSPYANSRKGYMIVLSNQPGSDHLDVDSKTEYEMPRMYFGDDWGKLGAALEKAGIKYDAKFGVVSYRM